MVEEAWQASTGMGVGIQGVWDRLKEVSTAMSSWSRHTFGSVRREIKRVRDALEEEKLDLWSLIPHWR
jgi:hypothetical protein